MKALSIHIPTPCHEDWQQMTPVDKGRFCQSCVKQVVDFSVMTDQQILNYIANASGSMCGRFAGDQLQRPLQPIQQQKKKAWWIAAMMPLLLLFEKSGAQKKGVTENVIKLKESNNLCDVVIVGAIQLRGGASDYWQVPDEDDYATSNKLAPAKQSYVKKIGIERQRGDAIFAVSGRIVYGNEDKPLSFATITIKGTNKAVASDAEGRFTISGNTTEDYAVLTVNGIGFADAEIYVEFKTIDAPAPAINQTITGRVEDSNGNPISFASIMLKGTRIGVAADQNGNFTLNLTPGLSKPYIILSAVAFETKEVFVPVSDPSGIIKLSTIKMQHSAQMSLGIVVITARKRVKTKYIKKDAIANAICKVFNTEKFKVFPNPAPKGGNVTVEIKNKGNYSIQLFDNNGKLLTAKPFEAVNDKTQTSIEIPASAVAGTYYIMLVDDKNKKQYTDKIIVL